MILFKIYNLITIIFYPLIYIYLLYRKSIGKEDKIRFRERLGYASSIRVDKYLIWIHAVSVGEVKSIILLSEKLIQKYKSNILITTGTVSGAKLISDKLNKKIIHQYIPIDNKRAIKRFINHWRPDLILWTESEIWPNIINNIKDTAPLILINASISDKSYNSWMKYKNTVKQLLNSFDLIITQSKIDHEKFVNLGANNLKYIGNIKYSNQEINDDHKIENLKNLLPNKKIILAASTHSGEEYILAKIYKKLKQKYDDIFLIIAPRHPNRKDEIISSLTRYNISIRSNDDIILADTDIYLADTIGELSCFYEIADIVFIGNSLVTKGGHNPIEAANFNCTILIGPYTDDFSEIIENFLAKNAIIQVENDIDLEDKLNLLLGDIDLAQKIMINAKNIVDENKMIISQYVDAIDDYIN